MCQCRAINCNKSTTVMKDVHSARDYVYTEEGGVWKFSVLNIEFSCKFKTSLKIKSILYFLYHKLLYCCSITVVCIFSPPLPNPPPSLASILPLGFVHVSFIVVPENPSPHSPLVSVRLFLISMSLVIFCLLFPFVDYVPVKGEIIWYLSLNSWLISLSIMLSSSIHAIAKVISSFFLSAA